MKRVLWFGCWHGVVGNQGARKNLGFVAGREKRKTRDEFGPFFARDFVAPGALLSNQSGSDNDKPVRSVSPPFTRGYLMTSDIDIVLKS